MKIIKYKSREYIPKDFTGVCQTMNDFLILNFKNGQIHREDGPAIIRKMSYSSWYYKDKCYGHRGYFTIETWKEFVENKKREEELNIFI